MKQGKPLERRTPLKQGKPLQRRAPVRSGAPLARQAPKKKPLKRAVMPKDVREAVIARAAGRCEHCGRPLVGKVDIHHRKLRTRGGDDSLGNLMAVTPWCHHEQIHKYPKAAAEHGHQVHAWEDPNEIPVRLAPEGYPAV